MLNACVMPRFDADGKTGRPREQGATKVFTCPGFMLERQRRVERSLRYVRDLYSCTASRLVLTQGIPGMALDSASICR